jgi:hypothetical protein
MRAVVLSTRVVACQKINAASASRPKNEFRLGYAPLPLLWVERLEWLILSARPCHKR